MAETIDFKIGKVPTLRLPEDGNFAVTFAFAGIDLTGYDATLTAQNGQSNLRTPLFWSLSGLTVSAAEIAFDVAQADEDDTNQAFSLVTSSGFTDYALTVYDSGVIVMRLQGDIEWIERVGAFDTVTPASNEIEVIVDGSTAVTVAVTGGGGGGGGGGISVLDTNTPTSGLTGILKSASNTLDVAVAGTDYLAPNGDGSALTGLFNPASPGAIGGTTPNEITSTKYKGAAGNPTLECSGYGAAVVKGGVGTGASAFAILEFHDTAGARIGYMYMDPGGAMAFMNERNGALLFGVNGVDRIIVYPSGGVYIGPSPVDPGAYNLNVRGDIKVGEDASAGEARRIASSNATADNNQGGKLTVAGGTGHGTGAQGDVELEGDEIILDAGSHITCDAPLGLAQYTYSTFPSAASHTGRSIVITDAGSDSGAGGSRFDYEEAVSNGTYWRYKSDGNLVGGA